MAGSRSKVAGDRVQPERHTDLLSVEAQVAKERAADPEIYYPFGVSLMRRRSLEVKYASLPVQASAL
jgi:hypothetical protein